MKARRYKNSLWRLPSTVEWGAGLCIVINELMYVAFFQLHAVTAASMETGIMIGKAWSVCFGPEIKIAGRTLKQTVNLWEQIWLRLQMEVMNSFL